MGMRRQYVRKLTIVRLTGDMTRPMLTALTRQISRPETPINTIEAPYSSRARPALHLARVVCVYPKILRHAPTPTGARPFVPFACFDSF